MFPAVPGVTIYFSDFKRSLVDKLQKVCNMQHAVGVLCNSKVILALCLGVRRHNWHLFSEQ
jgi:hypothetical protein